MLNESSINCHCRNLYFTILCLCIIYAYNISLTSDLKLYISILILWEELVLRQMKEQVALSKSGVYCKAPSINSNETSLITPDNFIAHATIVSSR